MRDASALGPGAVLIAPLRIQQIVSNLVSNTVKFTCGGTVPIVARSVRRNEAPWLEIAISDDGIGIPGDELKKVFNPFHPVETGHDAVGQGTGLGLSIACELARRMGGDLTVVSTPGRGAAFTLAIPAPTDPAGEMPVRSSARSLASRHLLIVDTTPPTG